EHVAVVDRLRAVAAPGRQREYREALDQPYEERNRTAAGADDDRGAQRNSLTGGVEQRLLDRQAGGKMARYRITFWHQAAEIDDPADAGSARGGGKARAGARRARASWPRCWCSGKPLFAGPSIEWIR